MLTRTMSRCGEAIDRDVSSIDARQSSWTAVLFVVTTMIASPVAAQELEPGAYSVSPVGMNFVNAAYSFNSGDVAFEPSVPIEQAHARINTLALNAGRAIGVAGRSGTFLVALPIVVGHAQGLVGGVFQVADRRGIGDLRVRLGVNLYGAPAMTLKELAQSRRRTTFGTSLTVVVPVGQYDPQKLINLGTNRWSFKPELAVTHNTGTSWLFEAYGGVWLFTNNNDFYGGVVREQEPIGSVQFHVRYTVKPGLWVSLNSNFYYGGRTTLDGHLNVDLQKNSRLGGTLSLPLSRHDSLRVAVSRGAYTTIGADFTSLSVAYSHFWGGGM
jgi:hypothetical protein